MNFAKIFLAVFVCLGLVSCTEQNLQDYASEKPRFDLKDYFNGSIKAWGLVQDYTGEVTRRFEVDMIGSWQDNVGTLEEDFVYSDGEEQRRVWIITKHSDSRYTGKAQDIIGEATGEVAGNAMRWAYEMDLVVDGETYRITFDDWMYLMNDGVLINRSYLKKFGFTVGELTLFMQKQG